MHRRSVGLALVLALFLAAATGALAGKTPVDVSGAEFAGAGTLKAKIKGFGSEKGPAEFTLEFGARAGLAADQFLVVLDDGQETIELPGTWALDAKNKLVLTPDAPALTAEMTDLFWRYAGGQLPGVSIDIDVTRVKIKPKPKVKKKTGETTMKLQLKFTFIVTASALGQTETVKTTLIYKGKGAKVI